MNFAKMDINPPNSNVVVRTMTRVELIIKLALGEIFLLIYKLKANAMAPLMMPLNQISISCLRLRPILNFLQIPMSRAGINTPHALAIMHDISKKKTKL